jgi:hypothetical protein
MHDERLAKIIALWRSTQHDGERQAARAKGERLTKQLGMSFEDAVVADDVHNHPRNGDIFAGFDDFMEAKEPGYKAAAAREKAEKIAAREARRKAIIERYGSAEAALAPCERELMLQKAVERWRKPCNPPHERWTHSVDGWCFYSEAPPERVETALRNAYPLPETFPVARAEYDYWRARDHEMEDVLNGDVGDFALDLLAVARMMIVEALIETELVVRTPGDLLERFRLYREREYHDRKSETKIFNDLERIVADESAHPSIEDTSPSAAAHPTSTDTSPSIHRGQIGAALKADPSRSDRSVAREMHCPPTTVGRIRASLGLADAPRSVHRRGQMFEARYHRQRTDGSSS